MPYGIELFLDPRGEALIRRVWEALAESGVDSTMVENGSPPHVTYAIYEDVDRDIFEYRLDLFARTISPIPMNMTHLGVFSAQHGVVFLAATATRELLDLHAELHRFFGSHYEASWEYYQPGHWIPHVTLAYDLPPEHLPVAVAVCERLRLPIEVRLEQIALMEFEMPRRRFPRPAAPEPRFRTALQR